MVNFLNDEQKLKFLKLLSDKVLYAITSIRVRYTAEVIEKDLVDAQIKLSIKELRFIAEFVDEEVARLKKRKENKS